jgi:hypothetical protein
MKKITRRKISFPTYNTHFFVYFPLWAPSTSNLITFFFVIHFKQFKVLYKRHLKFYKSFLNFNSNRTTYKEIFGCSQTDLCNVWWFVFLSYWPHLRWGAVTFSMFFFFWQFLVCQIVPIRGVQVLFGHWKQWSPPLGSSLPWILKCFATNWFIL